MLPLLWLGCPTLALIRGGGPREAATVTAHTNRFSAGGRCGHHRPVLRRVFTFLFVVFHNVRLGDPLPNTHGCRLYFIARSDDGKVFTLIFRGNAMVASPVVVRVSPVRFLAAAGGGTTSGDGSRKRPPYPTNVLKAGDKEGVLQVVEQFYKTAAFLHV